MKRRDFVATIATGSLAATAGCQGDSEEGALVTTYTYGYRDYQSADKTGPKAADAEGEKQSLLYERAAELYGDAEQHFKSAGEMAGKDAQQYCDAAEKHCQLKRAQMQELSEGNTTQALSHSRSALEYRVVLPSTVQNSVSTWGNPGNVTIGETTPASVSVDQSAETATAKATETATQERTETETQTEEVDPPDHLDGLSQSTLPNTDNEDLVDRVFTQQFNGAQTEFSLRLSESLYKYYNERVRVADYGAYASDTLDDPSIRSLADTFENYGERKDHSSRQIIDHVIAWVQGMEYTQDKPATGYNEYPKYPLETLYDRGGDCEDSSILLASVLSELGYGTVLLKLDQAQHMAVGVAGEDSIPGSYYTYDGQRYYYVETTGSGWQVGEVPDSVEQAGSNAELVEINQSTSLAHQWQSRVRSDGQVEVRTTVVNFGQAVARNAAVQVEIETQSGNIVAQDRRQLSNIGSDQQTTIPIQMSPPADRSMLIRVGILTEGTLADLSEGSIQSP